MSDWKEVELGDVVNLKRGYDLPERLRQEGKIPIYSSSGISGFHNESKVSAPGVITGRYGTLGDIFLANQEFWPLNTTLYVEDFKGNCESFIYYFFKNINWNKFSDKSAVPGINRNDVHREVVLFPCTFAEQKQIADILSSLDRKIENLRRQNETLEAIAQALFKRWFVDFEFPNEDGKPYKSSGGEMKRSELGEIPTDWCMGGVEDLFDFLEGPGIRNWQYTESGTRFINIRLIQNGNIEVENANFVSENEANSKYKHFHLKSKDLVISTSGTLGRCAIVREEHLPMILNTSVIRFRPHNQNDYEFMYQLFQSKYFTHSLQSLASGSVQLNFGPMHLRQIGIFIPSRNVLDRFSDVAKSIYEKYKLNFEQVQTLTKTRDLLLPQLMSGKLRIIE